MYGMSVCVYVHLFVCKLISMHCDNLLIAWPQKKRSRLVVELSLRSFGNAEERRISSKNEERRILTSIEFALVLCNIAILCGCLGLENAPIKVFKKKSNTQDILP